jgi:hypothetical protein
MQGKGKLKEDDGKVIAVRSGYMMAKAVLNHE